MLDQRARNLLNRAPYCAESEIAELLVLLCEARNVDGAALAGISAPNWPTLNEGLKHISLLGELSEAELRRLLVRKKNEAVSLERFASAAALDGLFRLRYSKAKTNDAFVRQYDEWIRAMRARAAEFNSDELDRCFLEYLGVNSRQVLDLLQRTARAFTREDPAQYHALMGEGLISWAEYSPAFENIFRLAESGEETGIVRAAIALEKRGRIQSVIRKENMALTGILALRKVYTPAAAAGLLRAILPAGERDG